MPMHPFEIRPTIQERFVYGIRSLELIKIGVSTDVGRRLEQMRALNPHNPEVVFYRRTLCAYDYEAKMHEVLADHAVGREWFRVDLQQVKEAAKQARTHAARVWRSWDQWWRDCRIAEMTGKTLPTWPDAPEMNRPRPGWKYPEQAIPHPDLSAPSPSMEAVG